MGASWMVAAGCSLAALTVVAINGSDAAADREQEVATGTTSATGATGEQAAPAAKVGAGGSTKPRSETTAGDGGTATDGSVTASTAADGADATTASSAESTTGGQPGPAAGAPPGTGAASATVGGSTGGNAPGPAAGASSCSDPTGEATTQNLGDMDLTAVELSRDTGGLRVRFRLHGPVPADAGVVAGSPATNLWQLLLASGDEVLYAFSVTEHGTVWETSLVDFASASGDRLGTVAAQSGDVVEALIPNEHLNRLPASFTWWALTNTDRAIPTGPYIGDDCPNGTGDLDPTQLLPPEASRAAFFG